MTKAIFLLLILILVGCNTKEIIYHNNTIVKEINNTCDPCKEKICEPIPDCVCNYPEEKECKTQIKTVISPDCSNKLNLCNIRLDYQNDLLAEYMLYNDTKKSENLTIELDKCLKSEKELKNKINNITKILK